MKAIGYQKNLPIQDSNSLIDIEIEKPEIKKIDLLNKVEPVSVKKNDTKIRTKTSLL